MVSWQIIRCGSRLRNCKKLFPNLVKTFMEPKRLGEFAQEKYDVHNEEDPSGPR